MRPRKLRVQGFTAFRDQQEIDFTDLDLFAVCGPTGSGKSSLLDAMTFALYGWVERVGNQTSQLISQGQPRLAVELEFGIGSERLKVSRTTSRPSGATARLEILDGGEWRSYGEGADQIREVNRIVQRLVGLDYDAFTRSVILPQGRFAEFLVGDAKTRRKILTELLGLQLFEAMSKHANQISNQASAQGDAKEQLLQSRYASVTDEAVAEARTHAHQAEAYAERLRSFEKLVVSLAKSAAELRTRGGALQRCKSDAREIGDRLREHLSSLRATAKLVATLEQEHGAAGAALEKARAARAGAEERALDLENRFGSPTRLASAVEKSRSLDAADRSLGTAEGSLEEAVAEVDAARVALASAVEAAAAAELVARESTADLRTAEALAAEVQRRDSIAGLVAGLGPGDPCPICERPLGAVPEADHSALDEAADRLRKAQAAAERASDRHAGARTAVAVAKTRLDKAAEAEQKGRVVLDRMRVDTEALRAEIASAFGGSLPADPKAELDDRLAAVEEASEESGRLRTAETEAAERLIEGERTLERAAVEVASIKAAVGGAGLDHLARDVSAAAAALTFEPPFAGGLADDAGALAEEVEGGVDAVEAVERSLGAELESIADELAGLVHKAEEAAPPGLSPPAGGIEEVTEAAAEAARRAGVEAASADAAAGRLEEDMKARAVLEDEIATARHEASLYRSLHRELRSDHIVDYLQAEALSVLAAAGSERLRELSGERYRLAYTEDRFYVIDAWNGEERRRASTLSGGETFLASLALALALADQVQLLAVAQKDRLESLFLDEGFGSLDAETLETVVGAIEQLGGEDRLVGVITHVTELAGRLPVRIEVEKSPRGSRVRVTKGTRPAD